MAAPAFAAAGAGASTETSGAAHNVPCPATVNAGELLIAHLVYEGTTVAPSDPSGWTALGGSPFGTANPRVWIYGRIADGSEGGTNINFGSPANTNSRHGRIYSFSSVRSDTVANVVGAFNTENGSVAQIDDVGVTTIEADSLAVNCIGVMDDNAVVSFTGESGGDWTEALAEYTNTATTPDICIQLQTATMAAAGTVNGGSQTMAAADPWRVVGFYIRGVIAAAGSLVWQPYTPTVYIP